jgi:hypothetical protein
MSQPLRKTLKGGHDPIAAGSKGGIARSRSLSPERASEIGRQAQLALQLKHKRQLLSLVGPALDSLEHALKIAKDDPSALIRVVTAILDRTGFHGKSGIEVEGELSHSGEIVHKHQLLDIDSLPLIIKRMMAASIESDWTPSDELEIAIKGELPMLQVKVELSKESKK